MPGAMPIRLANRRMAARLKSLFAQKRAYSAGGNQEITGEGVGFGFAGVAGGGFRITVLDEQGAFPVLQDVGGFVEEGEPQMIVGLAAQASTPPRSTCNATATATARRTTGNWRTVSIPSNGKTRRPMPTSIARATSPNFSPAAAR